MPVTCHCSSCGATYQVGEQFVGRKIKCPKCAAAILVAAAAPKTMAASKPLKRAARIEADDAPPGPPPVPPLRRQAAVEEPLVPGGVEIPGLNDVTPSYAAGGRSIPMLPPKRQSARGSSRGLWIGGGVLLGAAVLAAAIIVVAVLSRTPPDLVLDLNWSEADRKDAVLYVDGQQRDLPKTGKVAITLAQRPAPYKIRLTRADYDPVEFSRAWSRDGQSTYTPEWKKPAPPAPMTTLTLNWMESERQGAELFVDGKPVPVPKTDTVKLTLPVRVGPYHIRITRKGYEEWTVNRVLAEGQDDVTVNFNPLAPDYHDWVQDLDGARLAARGHGWPILIVFDKSNGSEDSRRLASVFSDRDLRRHLDGEYTLVYIDTSDTSDANAAIENADRNRRFCEQFHVTEYPSIVMIDADGNVIGFLGGFQKDMNGSSDEEHQGDDEGEGPNTPPTEETPFGGSAANFHRMFKQWQQMGTEISKQSDAIKSMSAGEEKNKAIGKLLDLLEINDLARFYQPQIVEWKAMLPAALQNRPVAITRGDCRNWLARLARCAGKGSGKQQKEAMAQAVVKFDEWKKEKGGRTFTDHNLGIFFLMNMMRLLCDVELYQEAAKKCDEALALDPPGHLGETLRYVHQELLDKVEGLTGSGAGFCIAKGGFILTTREVLRPNGSEAKKITIRVPSYSKPIPARLVTADAKTQIALLQADVPADAKLKPVILAEKPAQGERICALGFPEGLNRHQNREKLGVQIFQGAISALPGTEDKDPDMQADCRITPGSYGGPMCNQYGLVVGMVHKRSSAHLDVDAFTFALPSDSLRSFLEKHLPTGTALPQAKTGGRSRGWDEVKEQMDLSVVRVQCFE